MVQKQAAPVSPAGSGSPVTTKVEGAASAPAAGQNVASADQPSAPSGPIDVVEKNAAPGGDDKKRRFALARNQAALFGDLTFLAMQHSSFRNLAIADLDWLISPAIATGNFMIINGERKDGVAVPVAALTWARVSQDIDRRLMENMDRPLRLSAREYVSGDIYWLANVFGPAKMVDQLIKAATGQGGENEHGQKSRPGPLTGKKLKHRIVSDDGKPVIVLVG
jgi:hemolysin-activating ACP:hemolysin acyltransferase